ncbi:MAG: hypothetical protein IPP71_08405, partial [Bacteroidetes bacterium]|nr:hypothetical protein [Bacteroidota bacterium]
FTVTVTDGNGCEGSASVSTTVNPLPTPSISGTLAFCAGGSTTLDAGVYSSYLWNTGATTQTIAVNTAGTFTVTVTDGNSCRKCIGIHHSEPTSNTKYTGTLAFCAGGSTTLDAGVYSSYLWNTGATTQTIAVNTAGTFTVTVTDGNSCIGTSASVSTTVNPLPTPSISGTLAFCAGGSTTLDAGAYSSYLWNTGATTQTISVNTAGTFTVTVTDGNGCEGSASVSTTVNPLPTPSITGTLAFCAGGSTTLDAGVYSSYLWNTGATTQTIAVNTAGTFTVTVTDGNSCTGSASVSTTVNPLPTPSITGTLAFCAGGSTTLDAGVYSSYLWNTGATTQTISVNTAGTFTVTVTDGNGCTGTSASVSTTVNPLPTPSISGTLTFCPSGSTTLDAGAYSGYFWNTGATTQTILVNTAGTFSVTVVDGNGCSGTSASVSTSITPAPTAVISGDANICTGNSTNLTINSTGTAPWLYAINGGTPVSTSTNPETVSVSPVATTVYTITSLSDASCSGSGTGSATVTVSAAAPSGSSVITSIPVSGCPTNVVSVTTNVFATATSYTWSAPLGCLINGLPSPQTTVSNTVSITLGAIPGNSSGWQICVFAANAC